MMRFGRRRFLAAATAGAAALVLPGCGSESTQPQMPVPYEPGKRLPWVNWAGNQYCYPRQRLGPESEDEVAEILRQAKGVVRAVGAGHAFTAMVPTDDTLIATDLLSGLVDHDEAGLRAEFLTGTRLREIGPVLATIGQALPNMPDVDHFALGGAIAASVHGTGKRFGSLSNAVVGLTLATPRGELIECSTGHNPEIFNAARVSLGALGVITRVRFQNQKPFQLTEVSRVEPTEEVLADLDQRLARHRHFEFLPLTNSKLCVTVATDQAKPGDANAGEDDPEALNEMRKLFEAINWIPGASGLYDTALKLALGDAATSTRTGPSFRVFPHQRAVRFREMEYMVPIEAGPDCLREIQSTIRERGIPVCFPLEYRCVAADDIWLSMFQGRPSACIAVHQFGDLDYRPYFAAIEPIFWKYEGRPHWGKLHTLDAKRLEVLYPRHWQDFQEVRKQLDPEGKMLNSHLKTLFGV
jgi:FAD-linked oxidoreductase